MKSITPGSGFPERTAHPPQSGVAGDEPEQAVPAALAPQAIHEPLRQLFRDLQTTPRGLSSREAARRLVAYGPNEIRRRGGRTWPRELTRQVLHPLALLLWAAAALSFVTKIGRAHV